MSSSAISRDAGLFVPTDLSGLVTPEGRTLSDVKLIASDMDRTLLDNNGELPAGFERMLDELHEQGVYFAAASGRPVYTLRAMFEDYLDRMVLIGDNGGYITLGNEVLYESIMPVSTYRRLAQYVNEKGGTGSGNVCAFDAAYIEERFRDRDAFYRTFYYEIKYVDDLLALDVPADKFTVMFPDGTSIEHFEEMKADGLFEGLSAATSGPNWIDVMELGVDKGAGLRHVGEVLGIDVADMMAFGDTFNDKEMLSTAGFGFMVANATPGMEKYARYVAPSNDEAGVVSVARAVIEARRGC